MTVLIECTLTAGSGNESILPQLVKSVIHALNISNTLTHPQLLDELRNQSEIVLIIVNDVSLDHIGVIQQIRQQLPENVRLEIQNWQILIAQLAKKNLLAGDDFVISEKIREIIPNPSDEEVKQIDMIHINFLFERSKNESQHNLENAIILINQGLKLCKKYGSDSISTKNEMVLVSKKINILKQQNKHREIIALCSEYRNASSVTEIERICFDHDILTSKASLKEIDELEQEYNLLLENAKRTNHHGLFVTIYASQAAFYLSIKNNKKSLEINLNLEKYFDERRASSQSINMQNYVTVLSNIANTYFSMCDYNESILYHKKSLEFVKKAFGSHTHVVYGNILNGMATCYSLTQDYDKAIAYYFAALECIIPLTGKMNTLVSDVIANIAITYRFKKDYQTAIQFYMYAINICQQTAPNSLMMAKVFFALAITYFYVEQYQQAKDYFEKSLSIRQVKLTPEDDDLKEVIGNLEITKNKLTHSNTASSSTTEDPHYPSSSSTIIVNDYLRQMDEMDEKYRNSLTGVNANNQNNNSNNNSM